MKILRRFVFIEPVALVMSLACLAMLEYAIQKTAHLSNLRVNGFGLTFPQMCQFYQSLLVTMISIIQPGKSLFRLH